MRFSYIFEIFEKIQTQTVSAFLLFAQFFWPKYSNIKLTFQMSRNNFFCLSQPLYLVYFNSFFANFSSKSWNSSRSGTSYGCVSLEWIVPARRLVLFAQKELENINNSGCYVARFVNFRLNKPEVWHIWRKSGISKQ